MDNLIIGNNFFVINTEKLQEVIDKIENIMVIAKMSDMEIHYTSTNKNKNSKKVHDMIHFKKNKESLFYITFTYDSNTKEFIEFCLNPMNNSITDLIKDHQLPKQFIYSEYFFATSNIKDIHLILDCVMHIVKRF